VNPVQSPEDKEKEFVSPGWSCRMGLVFDLKKLGFGLALPDVDIQVQSGQLTAENHPEDTYLTPTPHDLVPSQTGSQ
jgi:hypothetical protein